MRCLAPSYFTIGPDLSGPDGQQPAVLTSPRNGKVFLDVPTFEWQPSSGRPSTNSYWPATRTSPTSSERSAPKNTRLVPLQRLPENTAIRSFYWYVVPCAELAVVVRRRVERGGRAAIGKFRSFKKQSVLVKLSCIERRGTPWVEFTWEPYSRPCTASPQDRVLRTHPSAVEFKWYEFQIKARGASWDTARTTITDHPSVLPIDLQFGGRFEWRVRPVDESGSARPWSDSRSLRTPRGVPNSPRRLKARAERAA
ncbi:MAG: hypothetical protein H6528_02775 [Actinobacteria bacterium]|nr:hypothetical protein [Actinomycetota bacterium]